MRINVCGLAAERNVKLDVIRETPELKGLQLCPQDDLNERFLSADFFANYVRVYLSGSFVSPDVPITIKYLAKKITFNVHEDNLERLKRMNINSKLPVVYSLGYDFNVSFVENFR